MLIEDETLHQLPAGSMVLVTGAGGFIGGRLTEQLSRMPGVRVRCLVRSIKRARSLQHLPVEVVEARSDLAASFDDVVRGVDYVFHCAYDSIRPYSNIESFISLSDACSRCYVKSLVHLSSFAVYQPFRDNEITEGSADGDRSIAYVDVKLTLEELAIQYSADGKLSITVLQPAIVYGPSCWVWMRRPAEQLTSGQVVLPDVSPSICNHVYVDDLIKAMLLAARERSSAGRRYLISGPGPSTWPAYYEAIAKVLGTPSPIIWSREEITRARLASSARKQSSLARAASRLIGRGLLSWPSRFSQRNFSRAAPRAFILPEEGLMNMYECGAAANIDRAKQDLGYKPAIDLASGMQLSATYLRSIASGKQVG
jgi:nucleoside-diphosphate-sugar epimerase